MAKRRNAGLFSKRKTKKVRGQGGSDSWARHLKAKSKTTKSARKSRRSTNPNVYDDTGKLIGKFTHKAAKIIARVVGGTIGKPKAKAKNPEMGLFKSPAAAKKYAAAHGLKVKSIRKVKKVR